MQLNPQRNKYLYTQNIPPTVMQTSHMCTLAQTTVLQLVTRGENID